VVRVLIADDHGVLRAALRALLKARPELEVIGEAGDGNQVLQLAGELKPDLVLMDISMPGLGGIDTTRELKARWPSIQVLILTVHEDEELLREAVGAGASGYVVKRALESELLNAMAAVMRGELYVHPVMTRALLTDLASRPAAGEEVVEHEQLTPRELQVLGLIAKGYTNLQIADTLMLSVRTVESHRANIMGKLGLHNRAELVRYAIAHRLVRER
jgi:two-component system, NarL family, response regulator NreC